MVPLAWWALRVLFAGFASASPAGRTWPLLTRATPRRCGETAVGPPCPESNPPLGAKGQSPRPGNATTSCSRWHRVQRRLGEQCFFLWSSAGWQCWRDIYLLSHWTTSHQFGLNDAATEFSLPPHLCYCIHLKWGDLSNKANLRRIAY